MGDLKTSIVIDLQGNLEARARRYRNAIFKMGRDGRRSLKGLDRAVVRHGKTIGRLGNKYTAFIGLGSGAAAARSVLSLEERTTRLGVQAGKDDGQIEDLKKKVFDTAAQSDVRIEADELLSAIEQIVEKTGNLKLAEDNMRNIALAIQATGASGSDLGAMVADMQEKFGLNDAKDFLSILDTLIIQGKSGSFTLQNLATQGERVSAAYAATGRTGPIAVREMGAILQMVKRGVGSADQAATAFERMISTITSEKSAALEKEGIKIWDTDELAKGNKVARSIPDIIKDIIRESKGDTEVLSKIFGEQAKRAITPFAIEFQRTGEFKSFDEFLNIRGNGSQLKKDSQRLANVGNASIDNVGSNVQRELDKHLAAPLKNAADAVNDMIDGKREFKRVDVLTDSESDFVKNRRQQQLDNWRGTLKIEIEGANAKVKSLKSTNSRIDLEVDTGKQVGDL